MRCRPGEAEGAKGLVRFGARRSLRGRCHSGAGPAVEARASDRSIRFLIDAMLRVHPAPEPVTFDSRFQLTTRAFQVRGDGE